MPRAIWNDQVIAEAPLNEIQQVEGNIYFPPSAVNPEFLLPSTTHTICAWKGVASYYHLSVNNKLNKDAAWFYPETSSKASHIQNFIAFWRGVEVVE
ncbi:DUF427 domain-containing protein [Methylomonas sp. AM2-LC]|uniref:DUF427 domain-containing protein n=1 Tax=Methylomonas sp. AM2-LC TaxID=3153301 RepID=UPI003267732B